MVEIVLTIPAPSRQELYKLLISRLPETPEVKVLAFRHMEYHHGAYRGRISLPNHWANKLTPWRS